MSRAEKVCLVFEFSKRTLYEFPNTGIFTFNYFVRKCFTLVFLLTFINFF